MECHVFLDLLLSLKLDVVCKQLLSHSKGPVTPISVLHAATLTDFPINIASILLNATTSISFALNVAINDAEWVLSKSPLNP